jgi:hypothetical protein
MADKDRKTREAALLAAARREAGTYKPDAPAATPAPANAPAPNRKTVEPAATPQPAVKVETPPLDPAQRLAMLMDSEREERERRQARTRRNGVIAFAVLSIPILLWMLASVLRR